MNPRFAAIAALVLGIVAVLVLLRGDGDPTLRAAFAGAVQVTPGQEVRVAGRPVGSVQSVEEVDGEAIVELGISDDELWPLTRGTTARLRWGSTSGYALRYVELHPGPESAPELPEDGVLPRAETTTPVELDQVYRVFRGRGREDLGVLVDELGATFGPRAEELARTLEEAPAGLEEAAQLMRALAADQHALRTLAVTGDQAMSALAAHDGELGEVVGHAAATFDELAGHAVAMRAALERLPGTLATSTSTLARLDTSLVGLQGLVGKLGPGATALRRMAPAARGALAELRAVAPLAARTLQRGTRAAPALTRLLETGTPFLPRLGTALDRLAPMVGCVRPYTPEVAGFLSTWIGYTKNFDSQGHYARILVQAPPVPVGSTANTEQAIDQHSAGLHYAMPRPPGLNAGDPWFQPRCGAGPAALDPSADPENSGAGG